MSVSLAPTVVCQSSPEIVIINHLFSAPEPMNLNASPWGPVIALLRNRFARRDAETAKLEEAFIASEARVLELELWSSTAASTKTMVRFQIATW